MSMKHDRISLMAIGLLLNRSECACKRRWEVLEAERAWKCEEVDA
jgi:hypothetical protein